MSTMIKCVVHRFCMGDVDDPEIYAAEPIWKWQQTDQARWISENASEELYWTRSMDQNSYGYVFEIVAQFTPEQYTYYKLKYE